MAGHQEKRDTQKRRTGNPVRLFCKNQVAKPDKMVLLTGIELVTY